MSSEFIAKISHYPKLSVYLISFALIYCVTYTFRKWYGKFLRFDFPLIKEKNKEGEVLTLSLHVLLFI